MNVQKLLADLAKIGINDVSEILHNPRMKRYLKKQPT